jgi:hypothetical protein
MVNRWIGPRGNAIRPPNCEESRDMLNAAIQTKRQAERFYTVEIPTEVEPTVSEGDMLLLSRNKENS